MYRKLQYANQGRGGYVIYTDSQSEIKLDFEFGGGNCVAIIFIPSAEKWSTETGRPVSERDETLLFIASQALNDQVSNGYYKITDQFIELFKD